MKEKVLFHLRGVLVTVLSLGALISIPLLFQEPTSEQNVPDGKYFIHEAHVGFDGICVLIVSGEINVLYVSSQTCLQYELEPGIEIVLENDKLAQVNHPHEQTS